MIYTEGKQSRVERWEGCSLELDLWLRPAGREWPTWSACHLRLGYEGLRQVSMWCLTERAKPPPSGEAVLFPAILTLYREGILAAHIALAVRASSFSSLAEASASKTWRHACISQAPCCRQMSPQQGVGRNSRRFKGNRRYRWWGFCSLTTTLPTF